MSDEGNIIPVKEQMVQLVSRKDHPVRVKLKMKPGDHEKGNFLVIAPRSRSRAIAKSSIETVPSSIVMVNL